MPNIKTKKKTIMSVKPPVKVAVQRSAVALPKKKIKVITKPSLLLQEECAIFKNEKRPKFALPARCQIEKKIKIAPVKSNFAAAFAKAPPKKFLNFSLSPRKSFWLGAFFGILIMSFLAITFWALLNAEFVWASVR